MAEVRVFCKGELARREEMERRLDALLAEFGLERWASGYNVEEKVRDIAYETAKG